MAEIALADTQVFRVEELYLIRRGSGELVHRWSRQSVGDQSVARRGESPGARQGSNRDTLVSGFLTAITSFAEEAFAGDKSSLRALDLDDHRIYLRASPAYLLAAKCSGTAETAIELVLDGELLKLLAAHQSLGPAGGSMNGATASETTQVPAGKHEQMLLEAAGRIEQRVADSAEELSRRRRMRKWKILAALLALGLAGWAGWHAYITHITSDMQHKVDEAVRGVPELAGYPVRARVDRGGRTVWVSGLTPSASARERLLEGIKAFAPDVQIGETLSVLPTTDVRSAVVLAAEQRSLARAQRRLERLGPDLERAAQAMSAGPDSAAIESARASSAQAAAEIGGAGAGQEPLRLVATLHDTIRKLRAAGERLATAAGLPAPPAAASGDLPTTVTESAEELSLAAEQIGLMAQGIEQARLAATERAKIVAPVEQRNAELTRRLDELVRRVDGIKTGPSPREALEMFVKSKAVFFSNNLDYRDPAAVTAVLQELVAHAGRVPGLIRVVGYTDEAGTAPRNLSLSQQRADKVPGGARGARAAAIAPRRRRPRDRARSGAPHRR